MNIIIRSIVKIKLGKIIIGVAAALFCAGCSATLFSASCEGEIDDVRSLLQKGTPVNQGRELWCASYHGNTEIALLLLQYNADPNKIFPDNEDKLPLLAAVSADNLQIVSALLDKGAKVNVTDRDGNTPLSLAAIHRNEVLISMLIQHGADVDAAFASLVHYGENNSYCNLLAQNAKATLEKCKATLASTKANNAVLLKK